MYPSGFLDNRPFVNCVIGQYDASADSDGNSRSTQSGLTASGLMLVDTGSQVSILDIDVAISLGLTETGRVVTIEGVGGRLYAIEYTGTLYVPESNVRSVGIFSCSPMQQDWSPFGILGMDILSEFILTIHGPNGTVTLARP